MLTIPRILLLATHLVLVDLAMFGPLVAVWLARRARRGDEAADAVGRRLAWWSVTALALAAAIGSLLLLLLWAEGRSAYLNRLWNLPNGRLWWSLGELAFYLLCAVAFAALWWRWRARPRLHGLLAVVATTNLAYHFPPLFATLEVLDRRAELAHRPVDRGLLHALLVDPEVLARSMHVWLAAVAVSLIVALRLASHAGAGGIVRRAAQGALVVTLVQLPVGLWQALTLAPAARDRLFGGDLAASGALGLGILMSLRLMHVLAAIALGDDEPRQVGAAVHGVLVVVLLMAAALVLSAY